LRKGYPKSDGQALQMSVCRLGLRCKIRQDQIPIKLSPALIREAQMKQIALICAFCAVTWSQTGLADTYTETFEGNGALKWEPSKPKKAWKVVSNKTKTNQLYRAEPSPDFDGGMVSTYTSSSYPAKQTFLYQVSLKNDNDYASYIYVKEKASTSKNNKLKHTRRTFYFGLDADCNGNGNQFKIIKAINGSRTKIQDWISSDSINCDNQWNIYSIKAEENTLKFLINNKVVFVCNAQNGCNFGPTKENTQYSYQYGLVGYSGSDTPTTHYFDKITIQIPLQ
jgi:hypothetical protein